MEGFEALKELVKFQGAILELSSWVSVHHMKKNYEEWGLMDRERRSRTEKKDTRVDTGAPCLNLNNARPEDGEGSEGLKESQKMKSI